MSSGRTRRTAARSRLPAPFHDGATGCPKADRSSDGQLARFIFFASPSIKRTAQWAIGSIVCQIVVKLMATFDLIFHPEHRCFPRGSCRLRAQIAGGLPA